MTTAVDLALFPHQQEALERIEELEGNAGLFIQMGGGKTRVALAYARNHGFTRILVVLPLSVTSVWERECSLVAVDLPVIDLTVVGSIAERARTLKGLKEGVILINYESYWREPLRTAITKWEPQLLILDEAHRIRHRGARHTRFAHLLAQRPFIQARLALTGTPVTNGLQDAWSIFRFVNPSVFGRWSDFATRYLTMGGFRGFQIMGYQNVEEARTQISTHSFQWEGQLPFSPDVPLRIHLEPRTRAIYNELKKKAIIEIQDAQGQDQVVIARIVLTLILRLQQIACGFTREVGGDIIELSDEKATAARDLIEDALANHQRVIVFARFLHDLDQLELMLSGIRTARITGRQSGMRRKEVLAGFHAGKYDVILAQIHAGSLGIDFSPANIAIFFSVGFSLDQFLQAKGRLSGALRQQHPVTYYHLIAENSVDAAIYQALIDKTQIARRVTDLSYALSLVT